MYHAVIEIRVSSPNKAEVYLTVEAIKTGVKRVDYGVSDDCRILVSSNMPEEAERLGDIISPPKGDPT